MDITHILPLAPGRVRLDHDQDSLMMAAPEPLDSADLDAILELERSPGYALLVKRIHETLAIKRNDLEGNGPVDRLRGEIAGLRLALSIPAYLKREAAQGNK